ncbi:hypothetical protein GCM10010377_60010 [Streptomyces viridiviolaceus]|nr:hypothetical protein GCM10010377_60010 [Streptomyces viridiviolaceus]
MPAEASTTTDRAVTARMAQRGFLRRTGGRGDRPDGRGRPRCGGGPPAAVGTGTRGERGGMGKGGTSARTHPGPAWGFPVASRGIPRQALWPDVGSVSTVGRYDLRPGEAAPAARTGVPRSR